MPRFTCFGDFPDEKLKDGDTLELTYEAAAGLRRRGVDVRELKGDAFTHRPKPVQEAEKIANPDRAALTRHARENQV